jgi:uncharacterized metal-binding protein YceD (DUF177 family)
MAEFSLDVNELDEIGKDYSFPVKASWLVRELDGCPGMRGPAADTADGVLAIHAQKSGTDYLVRGHVTATVIAECYRCLEDVTCTVTAELTALYVPAPAAKPQSKVDAKPQSKVDAKPQSKVDAKATSKVDAKAKAAKADDEEEDLGADEAENETFSGDKLVLDSLAREHVILEVPMQPLCREDCPGIPIPEHIRGPANFGEEETKGGALRAALSKLETKK